MSIDYSYKMRRVPVFITPISSKYSLSFVPLIIYNLAPTTLNVALLRPAGTAPEGLSLEKVLTAPV